MPLEEVIVGRDEADLKKYGSEGTIFLGRHLVGEGQETHLTTPVLLDILRPHVITICGRRGEGKSYSMSVIAEEFTKLPEKIRKNLCILIIDTQGIFWTMKSPNEKESSLLKEWDLKPKSFDVNVYVPSGQEKIFVDSGVDFDSTFSLSPSELTSEDWINVFNLDPYETPGILLQRSTAGFSGNDIGEIISRAEKLNGFEKEKLALENRFELAKSWGIFGKSDLPDILEPGKISVLDVSLTPQNVRALLLSILGRKIFEERTAARRKEELAEIEFSASRRIPMPWILIDEAHNFIPSDASSPSADTISKIVKEGRQPGISLVLATQRPEKLHQDVLAQTDLLLSHRLTAKNDIDSLKSIMQSYMLFDINKYINELPKLKGSAIILDDNSERIYKVRIRPKQSWHAGASPVAV
jgi:DNA helicase HerA-like ATPase